MLMYFNVDRYIYIYNIFYHYSIIVYINKFTLYIVLTTISGSAIAELTMINGSAFLMETCLPLMYAIVVNSEQSFISYVH